MNLNLTNILNELRQYFCELDQDQLAYLILYGSQARGDAEPDSDIDILVVLDDPVDAWTEINRTSEYIADLCLKYDTLISRNFASSARYQFKNSSFYLNVRREGILL